MVPRTLLSSVVVLVFVASARADDWPQWRGPDRNGISKETGLLKAWPAKVGPKLLWTKKDAGLGFSGPAIVGDTIYLPGTIDDKTEVLFAIDLKTGKDLWSAEIGKLFTFSANTWGDGPRSTPTVDGDFIYFLGGYGDLVCFNRKEKGKEVSRKNLGGKLMSYWGVSESPLIDGDLLICTPGGNKGTLVALKKKTGDVLWRTEDLKNKAPYSSVVVAEIHGVRQYIFNSVGENGAVSGVDAKTGKVLWSSKSFTGSIPALCPTPIVKGNYVYVSSGYGSGCYMFEIDKEMKAKQLYEKGVNRNVLNTHGGLVLIGEHIYGHSEKKGWICQEFQTGKLDWDDNKLLHCESGSILAAEGLLYLCSDAGEVVLLEANPKKWTEISRFKIPQTSAYPKNRATSRAAHVWTHPVIADGRLFLRDCEFFYCYDVRDKK